MRILGNRRYVYVEQGVARVPLELLPDGYIGRGGGYEYAIWWVKNGQIVIADGAGNVVSRLSSLPRNCWGGIVSDNPNRLVSLFPHHAP